MQRVQSAFCKAHPLKCWSHPEDTLTETPRTMFNQISGLSGPVKFTQKINHHTAYLLAMVRGAAMSPVFSSLGWTPRRGIGGSYGNSTLNFLKNYQRAFRSSWAVLHSHQHGGHIYYFLTSKTGNVPCKLQCVCVHLTRHLRHVWGGTQTSVSLRGQRSCSARGQAHRGLHNGRYYPL